MEGKSFEEELALSSQRTLKQLQSTLLFHQTKLKESFRQARQEFSLARQDISLATEKLHRSIKAAIKEEVDHEEQFDFLGVQLNQRIPNRTVKARCCFDSRKNSLLLFIGYCSSEHYSSETLFTSRNCPSREGMEGKSFEEELAEITETLKRLQSTLLFHQTKLKESFRQARQEFSLARQDISLATEKLHRSIKAAIKEEVDHEEQFDFLGVQLNQRIPNRTVKARKVKARLFWRKFIVTIDQTRRPKSIQSVVMLRLGHHHPSVARGNIRVLGLNVQRVILDLFIKFAIGRFYTTREIKDKFGIPESRGSRFQRSTLRTRCFCGAE
ncbi:hypothetical protein Tco_0918493 [Tanacetum coccineum]